jgi:hypothetical protein
MEDEYEHGFLIDYDASPRCKSTLGKVMKFYFDPLDSLYSIDNATFHFLFF